LECKRNAGNIAITRRFGLGINAAPERIEIDALPEVLKPRAIACAGLPRFLANISLGLAAAVARLAKLASA
jgi:hypothetical protein